MMVEPSKDGAGQGGALQVAQPPDEVGSEGLWLDGIWGNGVSPSLHGTACFQCFQ